LAFQAKENVNLYLTYARGFRAGGLSTSDPVLYSYRPEYSNNIEAGIKQTYWENRIRFNASVFYIKANDVQVPTLVLPQAITITRNAGVMTSKGVEAEISTTLAKGLQLDYNFGLTDAKYKTLNLATQDNEGNTVSVNLKGNRQIYTPKSTSMLALQYSLSLGTSWDIKLVARGEWMYIGKTYFNLGNNISQDAYNLINTRIGLAAKGFEVMFWARNLGDTKYITYAYDFGAAHLGDSRNYGVTIRKNF
jgi:iron complex outermembrane receptor protein